MNTLTRDLKLAGGVSAVAGHMGISPQRLVNWRSRGRIPSDMVIRYCEARKWQITPHELRPDIYPNPEDGLPANKRGGTAA